MYLFKKLKDINQVYIPIFDFGPASRQITNAASVELFGFGGEKILKITF